MTDVAAPPPDAEADATAAIPDGGPEADEAGHRRPRRWDREVRRENLAVVGCWAILAIPLAVAAVAAARPQWFPIQDLAQYELRVRDVGTRHTPLVGLAGRIGPWYDPGSHPGPLSFWFLAPVWRLLGSSSAALVASAVFLHATAMGLVLWMAKRRAGLPLVAATTAALAVLGHFYGPHVYIEPWNPYLPVSWWLVLLFAVWSVLDGDLPMLIPAVVAGSFCAQTHLPYVGLVGGLAAFLVVPLVLAFRQARREEDPAASRRLLRWVGGAAALGVVLWLPPLIDQIWGQGNLTRIKDSVSNPTEGVSGFVHGPAELLRNLDPTALLAGRDLTGVSHVSGLNIPATLLLLAWGASVVVAWRRGWCQLRRLHMVLGAALALAMFSSTRIYGLLWSYLFLWAWGITVVMIVAIAWTATLLVRERLPEERQPHLVRVAVGASLAVALGFAAVFAVGNRDALPARTDLSHDLGVVSGQLIRHLAKADVPGGGKDGTYRVQWTDPVTIGSQGWGLVDELERHGYTAGFSESFGVGGTKHRVIDDDEASAIVQIVVGTPDIAEWRAKPDAVEAAYVDSRTPAERERYADMIDAVERRLRAGDVTMSDGKAAADEWRRNLFTTSIDGNIPEDIRAEMRKVLAIPAPVALFVTDPPR